MNDMPRLPRQLPTTLAADGVPRYRWTLAQFERLSELGFFAEDDQLELIGGELLPMPAKGIRHERIRDEIAQFLGDRVRKPVRVHQEIGWRPGGDTYVVPDIFVSTGKVPMPTVPASELLLVIEVADSSLKFDSGLKAETYSALGIREYWVVNATSLTTRVFREPGEAGYARAEDFGPDATLTPLFVPELSLRLADLNLG